VTLETIYYLSSIVASTGVIGSLIFVGLQLRQNTEALRTGAANHYQASVGEVELFVAQNMEFAELLVKGRAGEEVSDAERLRLWVFYGNGPRTWQNVYLQYSNGALSPELWSGFRARLAQVVNEDKGLVEHWGRSKTTFTSAFNALISEIVVEGGLNL